MTSLFLTLILAAVVIIFSIQNADLMAMKFLYWTFSLPKVVVLFISLFMGVVITALLSTVNIVSIKKATKELEAKLFEKDNKIKELQEKEKINQ